MTAFDLLVALHKPSERQGPGSTETTIRALNLLGIDQSSQLNICDIGCGTGAQTLDLARHTSGKVIAVDIFDAFLEELNHRAKAAGLDHRINTQKHSMDELPFAEESFDLIWSEGAIYNMGFEKGVHYWKTFLKTGGYLAVSEISWLTDQRPPDLEAFWKEAYPEIDTISGKIKVLEKAGFTPLAHFVLPPTCWLDHYYLPLEARHETFLDKYSENPEAGALVASDREEIALYRKYQDFYSYGFYLAKKL